MQSTSTIAAQNAAHRFPSGVVVGEGGLPINSLR
jgi:hypothetical protein